MNKCVIIPQWVLGGIKKNHLAFPGRLHVWGCDTETADGEPISLQIYNGADGVYFPANRKNILDLFLSYCRKNAVASHVNLAYFHELEFDISVLLVQYHYKWFSDVKPKSAAGTRSAVAQKSRSSFQMKYKGWNIEVFLGSVVFAFFKHEKLNIAVKLLDSRAFFRDIPKSGLASLCVQLSLPVKKYDRPKCITEGRSPRKDEMKAFKEYAVQDAVAEWHLAQWIIDQYREYNTRICVSSSQFSARIFRHFYLKDDDVIKLPPRPVIDASLDSYHGGKNGFYVKYPTIVEKCYDLDVVSMYPFAMTKIPNFLAGDYMFRPAYDAGHEGVWNIAGEIVACKYPIIYDRHFKPCPPGYIKNTWVTSYELKEALKMGEFIPEKMYGYVWVEDSDNRPDHNPFNDFVWEFFNKKNNTPKTDSKYILYKVILNSLYGKMIQTIPDDDINLSGDIPDHVVDGDGKILPNPEKKKIFTAGGLFNPFIATLITGFARAYLHELEHRYKSLDSSTDSVKTLMKPVEDNHLGGVKIENVGKAVLLRNKLNIQYNEKGEIVKFAKHGFQGRIEELAVMVEQKRRKYQAQRLLKVKEASRQGLKPLVMTKLDRELDIDFSKMRYL